MRRQPHRARICASLVGAVCLGTTCACGPSHACPRSSLLHAHLSTRRWPQLARSSPPAAPGLCPAAPLSRRPVSTTPAPHSPRPRSYAPEDAHVSTDDGAEACARATPFSHNQAAWLAAAFTPRGVGTVEACHDPRWEGPRAEGACCAPPARSERTSHFAFPTRHLQRTLPGSRCVAARPARSRCQPRDPIIHHPWTHPAAGCPLPDSRAHFLTLLPRPVPNPLMHLRARRPATYSAA